MLRAASGHAAMKYCHPQAVVENCGHGQLAAALTIALIVEDLKTSTRTKRQASEMGPKNESDGRIC
jgi:hypothetical protein